MPMLSRITAVSSGGITLRMLLLDAVEPALGLLEPRAGRRAHVQAELAGVHGREEVLADERQQQERRRGEAAEPEQHLAAVRKAASSSAVVAAAQRLEAPR